MILLKSSKIQDLHNIISLGMDMLFMELYSFVGLAVNSVLYPLSCTSVNTLLVYPTMSMNG